MSYMSQTKKGGFGPKRQKKPVNNKTSTSKGGSFIGDLSNLAVPFAILLAKEGMEKFIFNNKNASPKSKTTPKKAAPKKNPTKKNPTKKTPLGNRRKTISGGACSLGCGMHGGFEESEVYPTDHEESFQESAEAEVEMQDGGKRGNKNSAKKNSGSKKYRGGEGENAAATSPNVARAYYNAAYQSSNAGNNAGVVAPTNVAVTGGNKRNKANGGAKEKQIQAKFAEITKEIEKFLSKY